MKVRPAKFSDSKEIAEIWNPYIKNTFTSANNALTTRTNHVKSILNADTESDTL